MTENECLAKMKAPGDARLTSYRRFGVVQILVTSSCNMACFNCTQGSQLKRKHYEMTPEQFEQAVLSLKGYPGVIGVFGGNPAMAKSFVDFCTIMRKHIPYEQRGLWCNDLLTEEKAAAAKETFYPSSSNLNCHMDRAAYDRFKRWWPEANVVGLDSDSRHAPVFASMRDMAEFQKVCPTCQGSGHRHTQATRFTSGCPGCDSTGKVFDESKALALISGCDINQRWSASVGVFRGQLRGYFCEVAMAMSILHQDDESWPDTGVSVDAGWWQLPMQSFRDQVRQHCFNCAVPLRGHGELAMAGDDGVEQTSAFHEDVFKTKRPLRVIEVVTEQQQLGEPLPTMVRYLQNAKR